MLNAVELANFFSAEFVSINVSEWMILLKIFLDATFYQTWSYGVARCGPHKVSQMVLRRDGEIVALALVRLHTTPLLPLGIAYVQAGPVWRKPGEPADAVVLQQALIALKQEFMVRRGLILRLHPYVYDADPESSIVNKAFAMAGFSTSPKREMTIILDIRPPLSELRKGIKKSWRNHLNQAEKNDLKIIEGTSDEFLQAFAEIYAEMMSRKNLKGDAGFSHFARAFASMPEINRPRVVLAFCGHRAVAGNIVSTMGTRAIALYAAVYGDGLQLCASYLVKWHTIAMLKELGIESYDLAGIDPDINPGTYHFKSGLCGTNGIETSTQTFTCSAGGLNKAITGTAVRIRSLLRPDQYIKTL